RRLPRGRRRLVARARAVRDRFVWPGARGARGRTQWRARAAPGQCAAAPSGSAGPALADTAAARRAPAPPRSRSPRPAQRPSTAAGEWGDRSGAAATGGSRALAALPASLARLRAWLADLPVVAPGQLLRRRGAVCRHRRGAGLAPAAFSDRLGGP